MHHVGEMATPFDRHLLDVYTGRTLNGLAFFEEHGYFDVSDTVNTVQMFRENVGLHDFWDDYENLDRLDPFEPTPVYPFGLKRKVPRSHMRSALHRTNSGRFALLDENGNLVTEGDVLEREREYRLKVKRLELDDDEEAELENELVCLKEAIEVIRDEKCHVQQILFRALDRKNTERASATNAVDRYTTPDFIDLLHVPPRVAHLDLPPYCGNLFVLRESIRIFRRSWSKRWCILDFQSFKLRLYKRSYWRTLQGELDLRLAKKVEMTGHGSFLVEFLSGNKLLMRPRNEGETASWVQLMRVAMQVIRAMQ